MPEPDNDNGRDVGAEDEELIASRTRSVLSGALRGSGRTPFTIKVEERDETWGPEYERSLSQAGQGTDGLRKGNMDILSDEGVSTALLVPRTPCWTTRQMGTRSIN